jgi:uncharacterized protein YdaU (DUF1376 family)
MHYYQFHIGDYRAATAHLSNEEDLAYRRLLDMYYDTERGIPADTQWVARRIRVAEDVVKTVLQDMFSVGEDGTWGNDRADKLIAQYKALEERNRANGSKGGRPKKPSGLPSDTDLEPTGKATINQEPITNNQEPIEVSKDTRQRGASTPSAPIDEIVALYNDKLPTLPRVTVVNDSRKRAISARWREVVTADKLDRQGGLAFFEWYFQMVGQSKFLTGKAKDWKADIDFLFNPSKFPRVVEGFYHKEQ